MTRHIEEDAVQAWTEANAVTGHNNVVKDICWSPQGEFLASTRLVYTVPSCPRDRKSDPIFAPVWTKPRGFTDFYLQIHGVRSRVPRFMVTTSWVCSSWTL
jgi:hypothetical protein